ncbi:MAG: hypothetical protein IMF11_18155 [Proteobacteria bacterium]|nr:hypothetical protein [Pseudomonadota bacterium]
MAISITTPAPENFGFILNATSADASACEELKAAPAAGTAIIIDYLTINSAAAITVTIGQGETGGAVTTALIGPVSFAANQSIQFDFRDFRTGGMKLSDATSLTVDSSGAGAICIFACGRIE